MWFINKNTWHQTGNQHNCLSVECTRGGLNLGRALSPGLGVGSSRRTGLHMTVLCVAHLPHRIRGSRPEESGSVHGLCGLCV